MSTFFEYVSSVEKEASSDHLVGIFGLLALVNRVSRAFSDLVLLGVSVVESCSLVACHR